MSHLQHNILSGGRVSDVRLQRMGTATSNEHVGNLRRPVGHEKRILAHQARVQADLAVLVPSEMGGARPPLTTEKINEIRSLRAGGMSFPQIAKATGVSESSAQKHGKES